MPRMLEMLVAGACQRQRGEDVLDDLQPFLALDDARGDEEAFDVRDSYMDARTAASKSAYERLPMNTCFVLPSRPRISVVGRPR